MEIISIPAIRLLPTRAPNHTKQWMTVHLPALGHRRLEEMTIPASHDAGMYTLKHSSWAGNESNCLTQSGSIFKQLELGVRIFDIRPFLYSANRDKEENIWYCDHFNDCAVIGQQGGLGPTIAEIINDVNQFTAENSELVILQISHVNEILSIGRTFGERAHLEHPVPNVFATLLDLLRGVNCLYTKENAGPKTQLHENTLNEYIGDHKAKVIITIEADGIDETDIFRRGLWPVSHLNLRGTSVTLMQDAILAIFSQLNIARAISATANSSSVLSLAEGRQIEEFPFTLNELSLIYGKLEIDYIRNTDLLTLCLAASYMRSKTPETRVIIVYGGALITDVGICEKMIAAICDRKSFAVHNAALGGDPWHGMKKSCAVYYWNYGTVKSRFAYEGTDLHFEEDILGIWYGGIQYRDQIIYNNFYRTLLLRGLFTMDNNTMRVKELGDPQFGVKKTGRIEYRERYSSKIITMNFMEGETQNPKGAWELIGEARANQDLHFPGGM
jgi:hypothetical protein